MKLLPLLLFLVSCHLLASPLSTIGENYDTIKARIKTEYLTSIRENKQKKSYKKSVQNFLAMARKEEDSDGIALAQVMLVESHLRLRELEEAEVEFSILEKMDFNERFYSAQRLFLKAFMLYIKGDYVASNDLLVKARDLYVRKGKLEDTEEVCEILLVFANNTTLLGNNQQSIDNLEAAREIAESLNLDLAYRAQIYHDLGISYSNISDYAQSMNSLFRALEMIKKLKVPQLEVSILNQIAFNKSSLGAEQESLFYYEQAVNLLQYLDENDALKAEILANIADAYNQLKNSDKAIAFIKKAIEFNAKYKNLANLIENNINLAFFYNDAGHPEKALKALSETQNFPESIWPVYTPAWYQWAQAQSSFMLGDLNAAQEHIERAVALAQLLNMDEYLKSIYSLATQIYEKEFLYDKAFKYQKLHFELSLKASKETAKKTLYAKENELLSNINQINIKKQERDLQLMIVGAAFLVFLCFFLLVIINRNKIIRQRNDELVLKERIIAEKSKHLETILANIKQGIITIDKTLQINKEHSACLWNLLDIPKDSVQFNTADDFIKAIAADRLEAGKIIEILKGAFSISGHELNSILKLLPSSLDSDSKHIRIDWNTIYNADHELDQILVTLKDVTEVRNLERNSQLEKFKHRMQIKELQEQMQPHFLFNCLNAIDNLVMTSPLDGSDAICKLADFYRYILLGMKSGNTWPLVNELRLVEWYIDLQKLRFGERLEFSLQVNEVDTGGLEFPCLLLQTLVENSIKHSLSINPEKGKISVLLSRKDAGYYLQVIDTGPGEIVFKNPKSSKDTHTGLKNTEERLKHLYGEKSFFLTKFEKHKSSVELWFSGQAVSN
jgi:tetratricopeptide (TPR) repeat protein